VPSLAPSGANGVSDGERIKAAAQAIDDCASEIYTVSHRLMEGLHPNVLDAAGIVEAIAALLEAWGQQHPEIEWRASLARDLVCDAPQLRVAIYRIVQECLNNVSRHAQAHRLRVILATRPSPTGGKLRLVVRDDGVGLEVAAPHAGLRPARHARTRPEPRRFTADSEPARLRHPRACPAAEWSRR
jgi:signal transduction histidine kinase